MAPLLLALAPTMRATRLLLSLALVATPAFATITVTADGFSTPPRYIGQKKCNASTSINFGWTLVNPPVGGDQITLMVVRNASTCSSTSISSPDKVLTRFTPTSQTDARQEPVTDLLISDAADGGTSPDCTTLNRSAANPLSVTFCVQYQINGVVQDTGFFEVQFATLPPTAPKDLSAEPGDRHLRISWNPGNASEKLARYDVHVVPIGQTPTPDRYADRVTGQTSWDVTRTDDLTPLQNDTTYSISVLATDVFDNDSPFSAAIQATPVFVSDFYDHYRKLGGSAEGGGGCSTGAGAAWLAGAILLGMLVARRRKRSGGTLLLLLCLAPATFAAGEDRGPRRFLVGLKIDRYDPKVDTEPGLTGTPYHDIFGSRAPLRWQVEFDWEIAHPFGSLLLGATLGYWQNYGKGLLRDGTRSQDNATLDVVPFGLIATYRFDWLADRYPRFPFIPYAQVGLQRALWASKNGSGAISRPESTSGRGSGWTNGYSTALGIAVALNAIDPGLAQEAYVDTGIQRTALFAEYGWTYLDNFGKRGALILSDRAWRFGLSVEF